MTGMLRAILSATLVLLVCPAPTRGDETDELLERARNEYPAAVKRLEMAYSRVRGSGRSETRIPILTTPVERAIVTDFSIAFDGDRKRVVQSIVDSTPQKTRTGDRVYCMNGEHAFWLSRDTSGKPYLLNGHGTAEDGYLAVADDEIMGAAGSYLTRREQPVRHADVLGSGVVSIPIHQGDRGAGGRSRSHRVGIRESRTEPRPKRNFRGLRGHHHR